MIVIIKEKQNKKQKLKTKKLTNKQNKNFFFLNNQNQWLSLVHIEGSLHPSGLSSVQTAKSLHPNWLSLIQTARSLHPNGLSLIQQDLSTQTHCPQVSPNSKILPPRRTFHPDGLSFVQSAGFLHPKWPSVVPSNTKNCTPKSMWLLCPLDPMQQCLFADWLSQFQFYNYSKERLRSLHPDSLSCVRLTTESCVQTDFPLSK